MPYHWSTSGDARAAAVALVDLVHRQPGLDVLLRLALEYPLAAVTAGVEDLATVVGAAVARVSKEVGYGSVSHFISEFRARFGVTPRAYSDAHALSRELRAQRDDQAAAPTS